MKRAHPQVAGLTNGVGEIWLRLGGDFEISDLPLRLPRLLGTRNDGERVPRRPRLLGIFLDGQALAEYNIYQTNRIRIVNGIYST